MGRDALKIVALALVSGTLLATLAVADERQDACKKAMNDRIQACTDTCTNRALAAASDYKDTNNNVKFGCLKGCAVGQILQMKACREGRPLDTTETNR